MSLNTGYTQTPIVDVGYAPVDLSTEAARRSITVTNAPAVSEGLNGDAAPEISRLVQRVFLGGQTPTPTQVVFCGVEEENDSSSVCAKAGQTLAALSSGPVCLVDANPRTPRLARYFSAARMTALANTAEAPCGQCASLGPNLWLADVDTLLLKGSVLLTAGQLKQRLDHLRSVYEYVLIDAPGAGTSGDALVLGKVAGALILVIEADSTRRMAARNATEMLKTAGVRLLGAVLSNRSFPIPERLYKLL